MPWSTAPDSVKDRYSPRCVAVWVRVANAELEKSGDEGRAIRVANTAANQCKEAGKAMLETETFAKAQALDPDEMDAWYGGRTYRRMRTIPFGGPIPSEDGKGRDLDKEYFDERTDIKPHWFSERPVMFHHGADPTGLMGDTVFGKATDLHQEEDGWWEKIWLTLADARMAKIRSLEAKGRSLFGSSTPLQTPGVRIQRGKDGHIKVWPHAESTLSFSPQNTYAILRPAKAVVEDFAIAQIDVLPMAKALVLDLDNLGADLSLTSYPDGDAGDVTAKAGRVLSARNEQAIREARELLDRLIALVGTPELPTEGDASTS